MSSVRYFDWQGNEIEQPKADPIIKTNADHIREMSDEKLAEWIVRRTEGYGFDGYDASVKAWLKWLREEVVKE